MKNTQGDIDDLEFSKLFNDSWRTLFLDAIMAKSSKSTIAPSEQLMVNRYCR
jgi:hypothetical protein